MHVTDASRTGDRSIPNITVFQLSQTTLFLRLPLLTSGIQLTRRVRRSLSTGLSSADSDGLATVLW